MGVQAGQVQARQGIGHFAVEFASRLVDKRALQAQHEACARPGEKIVVDGQCPQFTPLDASAGQIKLLRALELKLVGWGEKAQTSLVRFGVAQADSPSGRLSSGLAA